MVISYDSMGDELAGICKVFILSWLICFVILFVSLNLTFEGFLGALGMSLIAAFFITLVFWMLTFIVKELE